MSKFMPKNSVAKAPNLEAIKATNDKENKENNCLVVDLAIKVKNFIASLLASSFNYIASFFKKEENFLANRDTDIFKDNPAREEITEFSKTSSDIFTYDSKAEAAQKQPKSSLRKTIENTGALGAMSLFSYALYVGLDYALPLLA